MKIILVTTGQPSTNPRLVKEANALVGAGYQVKVYYLFWTLWALETDQNLLKNVSWQYELIGGSPIYKKHLLLYNKVRYKFFRIFSKHFNLFFEQSRCAAYSQLLNALKKDKAHHYIAHNLGALPPAANAAMYHHVSYSFDAEDFHRGQYQQRCREQEIDIALEDRYFGNAKFITTASPLINSYYQKLYPYKNFVSINNVFPSTEFRINNKNNTSQPLRLIWFSQTIGKNRGIEYIIKALNNINDFRVELNLYGNHDELIVNYFNKLLITNTHCINFLHPITPSELNLRLSDFDIGIASETSTDINNDIALSNKILSYTQAGLAILASNTSAQSLFINTYPGVGHIINILNTNEISNLIRTWNTDREALNNCKKYSQSIAKNLNWDNEKKAFLTHIRLALKNNL